MSQSKYAGFRALDPFFDVVMKGLSGLVDGKHYFETFAEDAIFESRYTFPDWLEMIRGRANLIASVTGYGDNIGIHSGDALVIHRAQDGRTVRLDYQDDV